MSTVVKRERRTYPNGPDGMSFEVIHHSDERYTIQLFLTGMGNIVDRSITIDRPMTLDEAEDYLRVVERLEKARP